MPFWGAGPTVGAVVTIGEVNWTIDIVASLSETYATVRVVRHKLVEHSRPDYRRKGI